MFLVDTNILVYSANADCPEHAPCREFLNRCMAQNTPWYVTWGILYEFVRIVTHPRVLPKPWNLASAWSFILALLDSPGLTVLVETPHHATLAAETMRQLRGLGGNIVHDVHTVVLMREHGIKTVYTRDTDFHRFPGISAVDPLQSEK